MDFDLPYHKDRVPIAIDDRNFVESLVSKVESYRPGKSPEELVEASLDQPIGSPKLEELARGKKNIVIISQNARKRGVRSGVQGECEVAVATFSRRSVTVHGPKEAEGRCGVETVRGFGCASSARSRSGYSGSPPGAARPSGPRPTTPLGSIWKWLHLVDTPFPYLPTAKATAAAASR